MHDLRTQNVKCKNVWLNKKIQLLYLESVSEIYVCVTERLK